MYFCKYFSRTLEKWIRFGELDFHTQITIQTNQNMLDTQNLEHFMEWLRMSAQNFGISLKINHQDLSPCIYYGVFIS